MHRGLSLVGLFLVGTVAAIGCGGPSDTDFGRDDGSAGDSAGEGQNGGSSQGGSSQGGASQGGASEGGSSQGGASGGSGAGSGQGGSDPTGGSSPGGAPNGGASGTETGGAMTGGAMTGGAAGAGGGSGGTVGGAGSGGGPLGGTGGRPNDCPRIIAEAQAALASAQVCDPNTDGPKCTGKVEDLCGCVVPVNDPASAATQTYLGLREDAIKCNPACLAIVCQEPTTVQCGIGATTNIIGVRAQCRYSLR